MQESNPINPNQLENLRFLELAIEKDLGIKLDINKKTEKGVSTEVYEASLNNEIVFVRKCKNSSAFEGEFLGYDLLKSKGIPVPRIVASLEKSPTIGHPIVILSSALGKSIRDSDLPEKRKELIYEDIGKLLKKIHEIKLEGFGRPKAVEGKLRGNFDTYNEYRKTEDKKIQKAVEFLSQKGLLNTEQEEKIKKVREDIIALDFSSGSLLHGDLHDDHVFITDDSITGIIDLGNLRVGDPRYDIAGCIFMTKNEKLNQDFKKGYGELANDPVVKKYLLIIALRKIQIRFDRNKDIKKETMELLYQLLAEL